MRDGGDGGCEVEGARGARVEGRGRECFPGARERELSEFGLCAGGEGGGSGQGGWGGVGICLFPFFSGVQRVVR